MMFSGMIDEPSRASPSDTEQLESDNGAASLCCHMHWIESGFVSARPTKT